MLEKLTAAAQAINNEVQFKESTRLPSERRSSAWASLLTSLATSENIEGLILIPLRRRYQSNAVVDEYLRYHGQDEVRHYQWLTDYVVENFGSQQRRKSISDLIFYDFLLPRLSRLAESRSLMLFALMYFYEAFTLEFYRELKREAHEDGLTKLVTLIEKISKDEARHIQGAKVLISLAEDQEGSLNRLEKFQLRALLSLFRLDMRTEFWCVHNRRVRGSTKALGVSPGKMRSMSGVAIEKTFEVLR